MVHPTVLASAQAVATTVGSNAAMNEIITDAFGNWMPVVVVARFEGLADKPKAQGFNEDLFLDECADAPILNTLQNSAAVRGSVSVAFVPTASQQHLQQFVRQ